MQVQEHGAVTETQATYPRAQPRANISETESAYRIALLVPGVTAGEVDLSVERNVLTFQAGARFSEPEGMTALRREIGSVTFARQFRLPEDVNTDGISAKLDNGVLTLELPKREAAMAKAITVS
ncbi:MAG: Hsp20/alpha crystallin family protein [Myxococcota bacterium]